MAVAVDNQRAPLLRKDLTLYQVGDIGVSIANESPYILLTVKHLLPIDGWIAEQVSAQIAQSPEASAASGGEDIRDAVRGELWRILRLRRLGRRRPG